MKQGLYLSKGSYRHTSYQVRLHMFIASRHIMSPPPIGIFVHMYMGVICVYICIHIRILQLYILYVYTYIGTERDRGNSRILSVVTLRVQGPNNYVLGFGIVAM